MGVKVSASMTNEESAVQHRFDLEEQLDEQLSKAPVELREADQAVIDKIVHLLRELARVSTPPQNIAARLEMIEAKKQAIRSFQSSIQRIEKRVAGLRSLRAHARDVEVFDAIIAGAESEIKMYRNLITQMSGEKGS
jgi:hypothetical protein